MVESLEGEPLPCDLRILVPPHRGSQLMVDSGLPPSAGWVATDPETLEVKDQERMFGIGDASDLPLSKAGSTAHIEAPVDAGGERARRDAHRPRRGSHDQATHSPPSSSWMTRTSRSASSVRSTS